MGGWGGEERKGGLLTEHEGTSRVDGYVQYLTVVMISPMYTYVKLICSYALKV